MDNPIRRYSTITREKRDLVIDGFQRGETIIDIARMLNIKRATAYNILREFARNGRRYALPRGGARMRRLDGGMKDFLVAQLEANPLLTLNQMKTILLANYPQMQNVSVSTISRALDGRLYTLKLLTRDADIPGARNAPDNKQKRLEFAQWLVALPETCDFVHLDETGFCLWTRRSMGRSVRGTRVRRSVFTQRSPSLNAIVATSGSLNIAHYRLDHGSTTRERVQTFVDGLCDIIAANLPQGHTCYIVLDGSRFHHGLLIPEEHEGVIGLKLLPPYSPFLNPVELAHSSFKSAVKRLLADPEVQLEMANPPPDCTATEWRLMVLQRCGTEAMEVVTPQKCVRWYQHTLQFLPRCLASQDII